MIRLNVDNSMCRVQSLPVEHEKPLRALLSYIIDPSERYFSGNFRNTRCLMDKAGNFPTGLLPYVVDYLSKHSLKTHVVDVRIRPITRAKGSPSLFLPGKAPTPYWEQECAAAGAERFGRGIIVAPTGVGKSLIAALICDALQVRTLIVVPSLELKTQLTQSLQNWFGIDKVGDLKAKRLITVENVDALSLKKAADGIDLVIVDEFHRSGAKTYRKLNEKCWNKVFFKIGLTATPFRSQDNERLLLESVLSQVIYRVDYYTAVEKNYIVPLEAYYYDLPRRTVEGFTWAQVYSELVVNNDYRNRLISTLLATLDVSGRSALCLVKEIKHGEDLKKKSNTIHRVDIAFANGLNDHTREYILEFNLRERNCLIGTTGILGEGVDTKPAEFIVIAGLGRSKNAFMQQCGRGFRTYPAKESCKIILFRDASHKYTLRHFNAQVKILKDEYGVIPVKLG